MKQLHPKNILPTPTARIFLLLTLAFGLLCDWPVQAGKMPAPLDFDGDGKTDFAVVRNTGGGPNGAMTWYIVSIVEQKAGGSTNSPPPVLQTPVVNAGQIQLVFNSQLGTSYNFQSQPTLTQTNWQTLTNLVGTGGPLTNTITVGTNGAQYFRVMVP